MVCLYSCVKFSLDVAYFENLLLLKITQFTVYAYVMLTTDSW